MFLMVETIENGSDPHLLRYPHIFVAYVKVTAQRKPTVPDPHPACWFFFFNLCRTLLSSWSIFFLWNNLYSFAFYYIAKIGGYAHVFQDIFQGLVLERTREP